MFAFGPGFSLGFKPAAGEGARVVSEWALSTEHSLLMHVHRGDTLRAERGTVWIAADVSTVHVVLGEGQTHTATRDGVLRMTGTDSPRVTVFSQAPLKVSTQADYGGWRHRPPVVGARRPRRRSVLA